MLNKRELTTRAQKLNFLNGLKTGKTTLNEIRDHDTIFLIYKSSMPDVVLNEKTGEHITPEEAQRINDKANDNQIVWMEGRRDSDNDAWWEQVKYKHLSIFNKGNQRN